MGKKQNPKCNCMFKAVLNNVIATANGALPGVVDATVVICNQCDLTLNNINGSFKRAVTGETTNFQAIRIDSVECTDNTVTVKGCMEFTGDGTISGTGAFTASIMITEVDVVTRAIATLQSPDLGLISVITQEFPINQFASCNKGCKE